MALQRTLVCLALWIPVARAQNTCYGYDDTERPWPSKEQLEQLGRNLTGELFQPGSRDYDKRGYMKNTVYNSNFPAVVYPENTEDVQRVVRFARENNIRPTVVSTGHDFNGRSSGSGTLSINMMRMRQWIVNRMDARSSTGKSLTIGTGWTFIEMYEKINAENLMVIGGSGPSVGPGGWTAGGGHSPVTRTLGLGVDNVLEIEMVAADGSVVTVRDGGGTILRTDRGTTTSTPLNDNNDLWWALNGGGGGVFGIVTAITTKLHDPPPGGMVTASFVVPIQWFPDPNWPCVGAAKEFLQIYFDLLRTGDLTNQWGGYVMVHKPSVKDPVKGFYGGLITFFLNHWGGDVEAAKAKISRLIEHRTDCTDTTGGVSINKYNSFFEYASIANDPTYYRQALASTLAQPADLEEGSGLAEFIADLERELDWPEATHTIITLGGAADTNDPTREATSVSPDLRTALLEVAVGIGGWPTWDTDQKAADAVQNYTTKSGGLYSFGKGTYYNEAEYRLDDWKTMFWKTPARYARLLSVKKRWDPNNLFWCHNCVGSDEVTYTSSEPCPLHFAGVATYTGGASAAPAAAPSLGALLLLAVLRWAA